MIQPSIEMKPNHHTTEATGAVVGKKESFQWPGAAAPARRGFTLIELLVVIAIRRSVDGDLPSSWASVCVLEW